MKRFVSLVLALSMVLSLFPYAFAVDTDKDEPVIKVSLNNMAFDSDGNSIVRSYKYASNDFYTFVPGEEVEVLVNTEDDVLLTMVPTGDDKLVDGTVANLVDDDYTSLDKQTGYEYAYGIVERNNISKVALLDIESNYIKEVKETSTSIKFNGDSNLTFKTSKIDDSIVIKDGERVTLEEVEEGDVLSKVTVKYGTYDVKDENASLVLGAKASDEFFVVSSSTVEGKLTKFTTDSTVEPEVTIDGEVYAVNANAKYVEDPSEDAKGEKAKEKDFKAGISKDILEGMKNEEVTAILDFVGRVVRIEFDGNIGDAESTDAHFYVATSDVSYDSSDRKYSIELTDEDDNSNEYTFASRAEGKKAEETDLLGRYVMVVLDEDEITTLFIIADNDVHEPKVNNPSVTDDKLVADDLKDYDFYTYTDADYDDEEDTLTDASNKSIDVDTSNTVVVTVLTDTHDSDNRDKWTYTTSFDTGVEVLKNVSGKVLVIAEKDENEAKYIVRLDDGVSSEDMVASILDEKPENQLNKDGEYQVTLEGEDYTFLHEDNKAVFPQAEQSKTNAIENYLYGVLVYKTKTYTKNGEENEKVMLFDALKVKDIKDFDKVSTDKIVRETSGTTVKMKDGSSIKLNSAFKEDYEDALFVKIAVDNSYKTAADEDVVSSIEYVTIDDLDVSFFEDDAVVVFDHAENVVYVITNLNVEDAKDPVTLSLAITSDKTKLRVGKTVNAEQEKLTIKSTLKGGETTESNHPTFSSDDPYIKVTDNADGKATVELTEAAKNLKKTETATVTATYEDVTETIDVTILPPYEVAITADYNEIDVYAGDHRDGSTKATLTAELKNIDEEYDKDLGALTWTWTISEGNSSYVNENDLNSFTSSTAELTAKAAGTAKVKASVTVDSDEYKLENFEITVTDTTPKMTVAVNSDSENDATVEGGNTLKTTVGKNVKLDVTIENPNDDEADDTLTVTDYSSVFDSVKVTRSEAGKFTVELTNCKSTSGTFKLNYTGIAEATTITMGEKV